MPEALMPYDALVVGGGPAGLSAALMLGRARKQVLLCDAGPRRNEASREVHGFVTRDGTTPAEFRRIAVEQLGVYPSVEVRRSPVTSIGGERGSFMVRVGSEETRARRILLCPGMVDEMPELAGFRELWGERIFQCPYCHGWEVRGRRFGTLVDSAELLDFALLLRGWTQSVVALPARSFEIPAQARARLALAGVAVEARRLVRLSQDGGSLSLEFESGEPLAIDALFARPPQRQVPVVASLGLALDGAGHLVVDPRTRETSIPGIYAAGDVVTPAQNAIASAASGAHAAAMLNHELTTQLALSGALD
ncbi:MAG TPA: NAD(P)/FAD-dependent oxidoreductase [Polyangiaceae bacterium]|nr:NAD(P)/FAD-dependent oxidoreductase [Polyangiaceae bacterium]